MMSIDNDLMMTPSSKGQRCSSEDWPSSQPLTSFMQAIGHDRGIMTGSDQISTHNVCW